MFIKWGRRVVAAHSSLDHWLRVAPDHYREIEVGVLRLSLVGQKDLASVWDMSELVLKHRARKLELLAGLQLLERELCVVLAVRSWLTSSCSSKMPSNLSPAIVGFQTPAVSTSLYCFGIGLVIIRFILRGIRPSSLLLLRQ